MPKKLTKQDIELFREVVKNVKPFIANKIAPWAQRKKFKKPVLDALHWSPRILSNYQNETVAAETYIEFIRPGLQRKYFNKLQQGKIIIEDVLDLHGLTIDNAGSKLEAFLLESQTKGLRTIRIIHGKGYRSLEPSPILKNKVYSWLQQWPEVLAFCSAKPKDGGTGAVYVLLRKKKESL